MIEQQASKRWTKNKGSRPKRVRSQLWHQMVVLRCTRATRDPVHCKVAETTKRSTTAMDKLYCGLRARTGLVRRKTNR
eukprot:5655499-Amphidinium_carterae.1